MKNIFFRNDDVRGSLDPSLIELTNIFFNAGIPICHAVEPANISLDVVSWLLEQKKRHPDLIEIIQHGYDHNKAGEYEKMEFGGNRTYYDQSVTIRDGQKIMNNYFGNEWLPVFTFPYGSYNTATLRAIADSGFSALCTGTNFTMKGRLKNRIGVFFGKDIIAGKRVSYHQRIRVSCKLPEISTAVSVIKKYLNENEAVHYSIDELLEKISESEKYTSTIGVLFHHRFHEQQIVQIEKLIDILQKKNYNFITLQEALGI